MTSAGPIMLVLVVAATAVAGWFVFRRPQTGLLALAALTPFNGLLAIIPAGIVPPWWKEALLALTILAALISPRARRPASFIAPWWPAVALLVGLGCVSAVIAHGEQAWIPIKISFIYVAIVVVLCRVPFTGRDRDLLVTIIIAAATVNAVIGIVQQIVGVSFLVDLGYRFGQEVRTAGPFLRSFGTFGGPFGYGLFLTMALLVGTAVALADPERLRSRIFFWLTPVLLVGLAVSLVRAAYLGLFVGLLWIGIVRHRKLLAGLFATGAIAIPSFFLLAPSSMVDTALSSESFGVRAAGWDVSWNLIATHPLGQGFGASAVTAAKIDAGGIQFPDSLTSRIDGTPGYTMGLPYQPDDYYIKILIELGPIGLWLFAMFLVCAVVSATRIAKRAIFAADAGLALGVGAAMVSAAAASIVSTYFEIFPMDVYTWLLLGAIACIPVRPCVAAPRTPAAGAWADSTVTVGR